MIVIYCTLISHNVWNIHSVFAEKLYLKLVEIQEYTDQYLEYSLNNTESNITMYTEVYHLIEHLTKGSLILIFKVVQG